VAGNAPGTCAVCDHPDLARIDEELRQGVPVREVARLHLPGPTYPVYQKHRKKHLGIDYMSPKAKAQQQFEEATSGHAWAEFNRNRGAKALDDAGVVQLPEGADRETARQASFAAARRARTTWY